MRVSRPGLPRPGPGTLLAGLVAASSCWVAYDNGGYGLASRSTLAIVIWWGFIVAIAFGLLAREPVPSSSMLVGGLIASLALWTFASLLWTPSPRRRSRSSTGVSLYLGMFIARDALLAPRSTLGRLADGLAVAITAVAAVALIEPALPRLVPGR